MTKKRLALWFMIVAAVLVGFGLVYFFFGLKVLTHTGRLPRDVLLDWESALYGAIMLGWGVTLLLVGRLAFRRDDRELKRALWIGLTAWLAFEAAASAWLGVWFNVCVDAAVATLFAVPLLMHKK